VKAVVRTSAAISFQTDSGPICLFRDRRSSRGENDRVIGDGLGRRSGPFSSLLTLLDRPFVVPSLLR
jgi:hypothetical protein